MSDDLQPMWSAGDVAIYMPCNEQVTVVRQMLHYDCGEQFYGMCIVQDSEGQEHTVHSWQLKRPPQQEPSND